MIDTHCHLKNPDDIKIEGLEFAVLSASGLEDSKENVKLQLSNDKLKASVGIHPLETPSSAEGGHPPLKNGGYTVDLWINELDKMLAENKEIVAVGECGLDFSQEYDLKYQEILFRGQIALSLKYKKPLIIHSRKAMDETLEILKSYKNLRGVIHCYSGGIKRIKKVLELPGEWFFGIDGNLTYEEGLQEVVKNIPKDRLVIETDSPELTPIPHRGEKNYPEYVKYIYQKVAEIWGMSLKETEKEIDGNARKLFNI